MEQVEHHNRHGGVLAAARLLWRTLTGRSGSIHSLAALCPLVQAAAQPMAVRDRDGGELLCNDAWRALQRRLGDALGRLAPPSGRQSGERVVTDDGVHAFTLSRFPVHDARGEVAAVWTVLQPVAGCTPAEAAGTAPAPTGNAQPDDPADADTRARAPECRNRRDAVGRPEPAYDPLHGSLGETGPVTGEPPTGTWVYDCRAGRLYWDEAMYRLCDIEQGSVGGRVEDVFARVHPDDREAVRNDIAHALNTSDGYQSQARLLDRNGRPRMILSRAAIARDAGGEPLSMLGVSWRADAQGDVDHGAVNARARLQQQTDDALLTGPDFGLLSASTRFLSRSGWTADTLVTHTLDDLIAGDGAPLTGHLRRFSHWEGSVRLRLADGTQSARLARVRAVLDDDGLIRHYAVTLWQEQDVPKRPADDPTVDAFTGALTPHAALQGMATLLRERTAERAVLALSLDLNDFRAVNETHGHALGDRVLQTLVRRLQHALPDGFLVGRVIGDEFLVAGPAPDDAEAWHAVGELVLAQVRHPVDLPDGPWELTANAGIAASPLHGDSAHALLSAAQTARGGSAQRGRDRYALYHPHHSRPTSRSYRLNSELARAVERHEFDLLYEPVLDLRSSRITGTSVRVRWPHARFGSLAATPALALHVDGETMEATEHRVLQQACEQALAWQRDGLNPGWTALGIAPAQFHRAGFVDSVRAALHGTGMAPETLRLEIGESTVMQNPFQARRVLGDLRALGVRVTLDGVGTRQTSLGFLRNFPVDSLKVDGGCVSGLPDSDGDRALLGAVLAVAQAHAMEVVAEGVRTQAQLDSLNLLGCRLAQGPLLGAPQPAEALARLLPARAASGEPAGQA